MSANARMGFTLAAIVVVVFVVAPFVARWLPGPAVTTSQAKPTAAKKTPLTAGWSEDDPLAGLDSPDATTRRYALDQTRVSNWIHGFNRSGAATAEQKAAAATRLRQVLKDDSPHVRLAAAELIEGIGRFLGMKPEEAVPACETLLADPNAEVRTRAAIIVWRYEGTPEAGKVLVAAVENKQLTQSYRLWSAVGTNAKPHRYPAGMVPALERVIGDRQEDRFTRTHLLGQLKYALDTDVPPSDSFRERFVGLVSDQTEDTEVRQALLGFLAQLKDRTAFDALRPVVVRLAADPKTAVPLRVRLIAAVGPDAAAVGTVKNQLANQLANAVADKSADPAFRAFAALFFNLDTSPSFIRAVEVMADTDPRTATLRRVLAERMAAFLAKNPLPPGGTAVLERIMAVCPSRQLSPRVAFGYDDRGEPWQQVPANTPGADFDAAFVPVLVNAAPQVLPAVVDGLGNDLTRRRNLEVLLKRGDAAIEADRIAVLLAVTDLTEEERPLAAELVGKLKTWDKLAAWFRANKPARERLPELVKEWKAARKDPVPLLVGLFTHERYEVRERVAAEIGKIGPDAKDAIPKLVEQLTSEKQSTEPYVTALAAIGPDSLPALTDLIHSKNPGVRNDAANGIGRLGPEVRSKATPVLRAVIEQEKVEWVKETALNALGKVNPDAAKQLGWYER
ncbi:MAG: HEAT repeat domain-containing protein [Armatimonadaceae bacterium]